MEPRSDNASYRIMVFTWNTESISLSETLDVSVAREHRKSGSSYVPGMTTWRHEGEIPDFLPALLSFIRDKDPDLVVIGFQEDRYPGSYFHSHLLPQEFGKEGYGMLKRTKLMGVGVTTYKGILKGDLFERGIRVSIYTKEKLKSLIEKEETELRAVIGNDGQEEYVCSSPLTRGKGATVSYVLLPGVGRVAFICCHLPFNGKSLLEERKYSNRMIRQTDLNECNGCFNKIIESLVVFKSPTPTHVIYFGDFNYRVSSQSGASSVAKQLIENRKDREYLNSVYKSHDELLDQMNKGNIYQFMEGVDGKGPDFLPTCKMVKGRMKDALPVTYDRVWKTGKEDQRIPSWCDRILYTTTEGVDEKLRKIACNFYDRFDEGTAMSKSDHAGVLCVLDIS